MDIVTTLSIEWFHRWAERGRWMTSNHDDETLFDKSYKSKWSEQDVAVATEKYVSASYM